MKVKGPDRKKAIFYIKEQYPIGAIVEDLCRSGVFEVKKNSVFEIYSDVDQVIEFDSKHESYCFNVRNPGCDVDYHIKHTPKRWVEDYYKKHKK